jgi:UDP-N-acetyl-D-glucosamine dehydrogenase
LKSRGAHVAYYDPYIPVIGPTREHADWKGVKSVRWDRKTVAAFDVVLISTAHKNVNYRELAKWSDTIVDTRNAMASVRTKQGQVWKA